MRKDMGVPDGGRTWSVEERDSLMDEAMAEVRLETHLYLDILSFEKSVLIKISFDSRMCDTSYHTNVL